MVSFIIKEHGNIIRKEIETDDVFLVPECFLDFDEITEHLYNHLGQQSKRVLMDSTHNDLIKLHSTVGMHIRNNYGLWLERNPYTLYSDETSANHPDQLSFKILESVHDMLLTNLK